jgi:hypothetical protein
MEKRDRETGGGDGGENRGSHQANEGESATRVAPPLSNANSTKCVKPPRYASRTQRKPRFVALLSGVLLERASVR